MARNTGNRRYRRNREQLLADSDICWLCGLPGADTADHVVPAVLGGGDEISNLRPAHARCNSGRGKKDPSKVMTIKSPGYRFRTPQGQLLAFLSLGFEVPAMRENARTTMKECRTCGENKPLTEFYKHNKMADGYLNHCKECKKAYQRTRPYDAEYAKKYYEENKQDIIGRVQKWREENRERHNAWNRQWEKKNPEYIYYKQSKRRALMRKSTVGPMPTNYRVLLREFYGNRCLVPGCERTKLTIDHVVPLIHGGDHSLENMQVLCQYHNYSKNAHSSADYRDGRIFTLDAINA